MHPFAEFLDTQEEANRLWQMSLPFDSYYNHAVESFLALSNSKAKRVLNLLLLWAWKYGSVRINVDNEAIIVGDSRIHLSDIGAKNALMAWIDDLKYVVPLPHTGEFLFDRPWGGNPIGIETWMNLIDRIPGSGAERARNLLELLGQIDKIWGNYWTDEAFGGYDDGQMYWILLINSEWREEDPIRMSDPQTDWTERDKRICNFGDKYIAFRHTGPGGALGFIRTEAFDEIKGVQGGDGEIDLQNDLP